MDLQLHIRVLWRRRWLMLLGLLVAVALAILSWVRVDPLGDPVVSYRQAEQWLSTSRLFVTRTGFPWGRVTSDVLSADDAGRLSSLAVLYAELASGDEVQRLISGPRGRGTVDVTAVPGPQFGMTLPIIEIKATATSRLDAISLARAGAQGLAEYIRSQQDAAGIAPSERVAVETLSQPSRPTLVSPRKVTLPVLVFVTVLVMVIALILLVENIRTPRAVEAEEPVPPAEVLQPVESLELRPPDPEAENIRTPRAVEAEEPVPPAEVLQPVESLELRPPDPEAGRRTL